MHKKWLSLAIVFALLAPVAALAANKKMGALSGPITGSFTNAAGHGAFDGTFTVKHFTVQGDRLIAQGTLTGTLKDAAGVVVGTVTNQAVSLPVDRGSLRATCDILNVAVGPLNVNLLGLNVDLSRLDLEITAQAGSGQLLGNLLCGLSKLLDSSADLTAIANKLNKVLEAAS